MIESDCVMNRLCKYIESVDFGIRNIVNKDIDDEIYKIYMNDAVEFDESRYRKVAKAYQKHKKALINHFHWEQVVMQIKIYMIQISAAISPIP